jgi:hypothetical protein
MCQSARPVCLSLRSSLLGLPRVFAGSGVVEDRDPQLLAERLSRHFPFTDFSARSGGEWPFVHRTSSVAVGDMAVSGGFTCSVQGQVDHHDGIGAVNLVRSGSINYGFDAQALRVNQGCPLLFSGGHGYSFSVDHYTGVAFHLDLSRLRSTAIAMAGAASGGVLRLDGLTCPQVVDSLSPRRRLLLDAVWRLFDLVDRDLAADPMLIRHLQLEDVLYRSMAMLLLPALDLALSTDAERVRSARQVVVQELIDWIDAHLHQPITLTSLELRTAYGRRTLQLAFHERCGCGPMQWIRSRRLE